tara:strand:+ start:51 stop:266 length:216 start_codon:yes stop_codon:yes gene_type:complete
MNPYIKELIDDFDGTNYEQFVRYIYMTLQREIDSCKGKEKDKYIKIRNEMIKYVASNRGSVSLALSRNKYR